MKKSKIKTAEQLVAEVSFERQLQLAGMDSVEIEQLIKKVRGN